MYGLLDNSCRDCKKRQVGCHATCQDYQEWSAKIREIHEKERIAKRNRFTDNPRFKGQY